MATAIAIRLPDNLEDFIIEQLNIKKEQGSKSGIFTESEVQNVFNLFDLKKEGHISKERCIKGIIVSLFKQFRQWHPHPFNFQQLNYRISQRK